jgi:hypothetical protein
MGDVIYIEEYKRAKRLRETAFQDFPDEVVRLAVIGSYRPLDRYGFALEKQQDCGEGYYLFKYFFPDFDW